MTVATYTALGAKATTPAKLNKQVFGVEVTNHELLKSAYTAYLANGRQNLAVSKTRGLVRGGGKKPWKQKGTGRARFGSSRNPIWRGGGIVFGPTGLENYSKRLNLKAKHAAVKQALSLSDSDNKISVIDEVVSKKGKTAEIVKLFAKMKLERKILLIVDEPSVELRRACQNIQEVKIIRGNYLNVFDILNADHVVFTKAGLDLTTSWLDKGAKK